MSQTIFTPDEVAARYAVSKQTVLNWLRSGRLQYHDLGYRTKRITRQQLDQFERGRHASHD